MPLGNEVAQNLLQVLLGGAAPSVPGTWWIGLSMADAEPGLDGDSAVEPDPATGYARVAVPNTSTYWVADPAHPRQVANAQPVTFAPASGSWGALGWWCLYEQATGATVRAYGSLSGYTDPQPGQALQFAAGELLVLAPFF